MANKKVLVGVQDANGNIVPQPWTASDTIQDQDGAAIYTSANPPPSAGVTNWVTGSSVNFTWSATATHLLIGVSGFISYGGGTGWYVMTCSNGYIRGSGCANDSVNGGGVATLDKVAATNDVFLTSGSGQLSKITSFTLGSRNIQATATNGRVTIVQFG